MTNASRAQVDLDALARDLRQDGTRAPQAAAKSDPLAELARIVGQDDPFRALLAARDEMRNVAAASPQAGWSARIEPSFVPEAQKATPADAFDQYLASVEQDTHPEGAAYGADLGAAPNDADGAYDTDRPLRRVSPRRRLVSVGAGIAVNDLEGKGGANDICLVDPRSDSVIVTPAPGSGAPYAPFVLDPQASGERQARTDRLVKLAEASLDPRPLAVSGAGDEAERPGEVGEEAVAQPLVGVIAADDPAGGARRRRGGGEPQLLREHARPAGEQGAGIGQRGGIPVVILATTEMLEGGDGGQRRPAEI